jgi:hypothetical protein
MAKGKKKTRGHPAGRRPAPPARRTEEQPGLSRQAPAVGLAILILAGVFAFVVAGDGDAPEEEASVDSEALAVPWVDPQG